MAILPPEFQTGSGSMCIARIPFLYLTLMREGHMAEMLYICTSKIETAV